MGLTRQPAALCNDSTTQMCGRRSRRTLLPRTALTPVKIAADTRTEAFVAGSIVTSSTLSPVVENALEDTKDRNG